MIIEEPRKRANRASLIIAIRYIHPSQTQKARRYLRICTGRPCRFTRPTIFPWSRRNRDGNEEMHRQINDEARRGGVSMGKLPELLRSSG